jgi:hypothetical protein
MRAVPPEGWSAKVMVGRFADIGRRDERTRSARMSRGDLAVLSVTSLLFGLAIIAKGLFFGG